MAMGMKYGIGFGSRPDGPVRYRIDGTTGRRIGILPATCKRGKHALHLMGYEASERDGELRLACLSCQADRDPDYAWRLTTTPPAPDAAELDDRPYAGVDPHFQQNSIPG